MASPASDTTSLTERFLRYAAIESASDADATDRVPSTASQWNVLRVLHAELLELGLTDAEIHEPSAAVMATLPATPGHERAPVVGFLAHVDVSPELGSRTPKPIVHAAWDGRDLVLPDDPTAVLSRRTDPELETCVGHDLVTASGTTLLGADDKSGVAAIMTAVERMRRDPSLVHGPVRIGFTTDEEVGMGARHFDVKRFGCDLAYTLDSHAVGRLEAETFSADAMVVVFQGHNTHPGTAYGVMVNSIKVAADFLSRLPRHTLSPETTQDTEGFVHPNDVRASVDRTEVHFIIRDFVTAELKVKEDLLRNLADATVKDWPGSSVTCEVSETYRNMREVLDRFPKVLEHARTAIRRTGREPIEGRIRGGTDGSILSERGLPTPNLSSGQHAIHSRLEWASVQEMAIAVDTIVHLCDLWARETR